MNLQMLKKAMLAYVSAVKFIWSGIAYPLSIMGKKFMNLRGYRVYGNSVQDGTPTPDNPVEIESVGDLSTKNLFNPATAEYTGCSYNDGIITTTVNDNNIDIPLPAGQYTISCENTATMYIRNGKVPSGFIVSKKSGVNSVTINFTGDVDGYLRISFYGSTSYIKNLQIEEGTTATEYEPYHKYKIPVVARGRNLIPMFTFKTFTTNGVTFTNNKDGSITLNGTPTGYAATPVISLPKSSLEVLRNNACVLTGFYNYQKNIALTLDAKLNGSSVKTIYMNKYSYGGYVKVDLRDISFDSISFSVKRDANDILIDNLTVKPLLEVGTTMPTSFEPYIAPVTTNIFLDEPLRKVGDYADYVDFERQKVVRNITHKEFSSSDYWGVYTTYPNHFQVYVENNNYYGSDIKALSNYYPQYKTSSQAAPGVDYAVLSVDGSRIRFKDVRYTTVDEWKAFLDTLTTPLTAHYILATPTEETVKLPTLPQFKGTTIYEIQTNIKPSGIEAKHC